MTLPYPTLDEVNAADHMQICRWYRFCGSPASAIINRPGKWTETRQVQADEATAREVPIMNRIAERLKEFGGFTPKISKALGWDD